MRAIQDQLDFKIATPSDAQLQDQFMNEHNQRLAEARSLKEPRKLAPCNFKGLTKNQRKRARKAQRKAKA